VNTDARQTDRLHDPEASTPTMSGAQRVPQHYSGGPSWQRGLLVICLLFTLTWGLSRYGRSSSGIDPYVTTLGRIEVTARLIRCPDTFPDLGAYRYTYVVEYVVLKVHRQDPDGKYILKPGDHIFVGHYKPRLPRSEIRDADWGTAPLGGTLERIVQGDVHRLALDYELKSLAPSGVLDFCYPPNVNRFFAIWTNPATP